MSTPQETQTPRERRILYIVAGAIGLVLVVLGLILFDSAQDNKEAEAKADQFIAALDAAGAQTLPSRDEVVRVLGTDGGATCEDPNAPLNRATLRSQLTNGATGPGNRPVVFDRKLLAGQLLILKIYCPDELPSMQEYVDSLKSDDVAK
jgi:hypothetical protein